MRILFIPCLFLLFVSFFAGPCVIYAKGENQSLEAIRQAVLDFVLQQITDRAGRSTAVKVGHLDTRLCLVKCEESLEVFSPKAYGTHGKTTVGVRCGGPKSWTLYVPVTITSNESVVVADRSMPRGTILTKSDFILIERDIARLPNGYLTDPSQAIGKILKRPVRKGAVLKNSVIEAPIAISRGSSVTLMVRTGTVEVRMKGKSLDNGALGERIKVQTLSSGKMVEGTIISSDVVLMDTP
ncbi:MAG: flagellar basal body P-ring formation chaperone FlgA [Thermodesulfobacteriota bacterium]|nr:flagellar basal body P-ring formation chaperone FlgA [Thermodesulfobacteriota bacterium]